MAEEMTQEMVEELIEVFMSAKNYDEYEDYASEATREYYRRLFSEERN